VSSKKQSTFEAIGNAAEAVIAFAARTAVRTTIWGYNHPATSSFLLMAASGALSWHSFVTAGHHSAIRVEYLGQAEAAEDAAAQNANNAATASHVLAHDLNIAATAISAHSDAAQHYVLAAKTELGASNNFNAATQADSATANYYFGLADGQLSDKSNCVYLGVGAANTSLGLCLVGSYKALEHIAG
jgi:hypothetical protein